MVNNAGLFLQHDLLDITEKEFDRIHGINTKGVLFGCQAAAKEMIDQDISGEIINTASISSTHAQENQIAYDSTKGAIRMITRGVAL